ncbi:hypothetical protein DFH06DRAFT_265916 [Mycena polygramma]|nr:hypothetical protein DFH06DRAFT_265916 [Mycena polygramma]
MLPSDRRIWLKLTLFWCYIPSLLVQAGFHPAHHTLIKRDALSNSGLTSASWIWASGATTGTVAFLKTFPNAAGKNSTSATIYLTACNDFTIWVNGQPIGSLSDWTTVEVLSAGLNASTNTFAVLAGNNGNAGAPPAGLLAAIKLQYTDGSTATVVSDSSWKVATNIPSDFPLPSDTSPFASATVAAAFGSGAWGTSVTVASPDPNAPTLNGNTWIGATNDAQYAAPPGDGGISQNHRYTERKDRAICHDPSNRRQHIRAIPQRQIPRCPTI